VSFLFAARKSVPGKGRHGTGWNHISCRFRHAHSVSSGAQQLTEENFYLLILLDDASEKLVRD